MEAQKQQSIFHTLFATLWPMGAPAYVESSLFGNGGTMQALHELEMIIEANKESEKTEYGQRDDFARQYQWALKDQAEADAALQRPQYGPIERTMDLMARVAAYGRIVCDLKIKVDTLSQARETRERVLHAASSLLELVKLRQARGVPTQALANKLGIPLDGLLTFGDRAQIRQDAEAFEAQQVLIEQEKSARAEAAATFQREQEEREALERQNLADMDKLSIEKVLAYAFGGRIPPAVENYFLRNKVDSLEFARNGITNESFAHRQKPRGEIGALSHDLREAALNRLASLCRQAA